MEAIGDSLIVTVSQDVKESVEFERNLEYLGKTLEEEENRLAKLEEQRLKMVQELDELCLEMREEKEKYRKAIDNVIKENEKVSFDFLSKLTDEFSPSTSSMNLLEACADTVESTKKLDYTIDLDIETIRCDLFENFICTKEDYLSTIKDQLQQKRKKLESQGEASSI